MVNDVKFTMLGQMAKSYRVPLKKQSGVVLVVSLVFLIALTAVGAALMQNTTTDMKMAGASQIKSVALQEAMSEMDRVIYNQVRRIGDLNAFTLPMAKFPYSPTVYKAAVTEAEIVVANEYKLEADCPHSRNASSIQVFKCNLLRVQLTRKYGRKDNSEVDINSGIAQQLLNVGN